MSQKPRTAPGEGVVTDATTSDPPQSESDKKKLADAETAAHKAEVEKAEHAASRRREAEDTKIQEGLGERRRRTGFVLMSSHVVQSYEKFMSDVLNTIEGLGGDIMNVTTERNAQEFVGAIVFSIDTKAYQACLDRIAQIKNWKPKGEIRSRAQENARVGARS